MTPRKLTDIQRFTICQSHETQKTLAMRYGVSTGLIGKIWSEGRVRDILAPPGRHRRTDDEVRQILELQPRSVGGCWEWAKARAAGYGVLQHNGERRAHRVAYMVFKGPLEGLFVCHHCDNRCCVNPDHLFLGTQKDNIVDAHRKGRITSPRFQGMAHGRALITDEDVREIRSLYASTDLSQEALGKMFGLSQTAISGIIRRKRWPHIK